MTIVREAMVSDPRALEASATAQDAAELLVRPDVRTVLVVEGERLVGCVTERTLVEPLGAGRIVGPEDHKRRSDDVRRRHASPVATVA